jgi:hypothetical protein
MKVRLEFASFANLSGESLQKMKPAKSAQGEGQGELYQTRLSTLLDQRHLLYVLANEPIGVRIASDGPRIPLNYGEMKIKDGLYHLIPKTGPR